MGRFDITEGKFDRQSLVDQNQAPRLGDRYPAPAARARSLAYLTVVPDVRDLTFDEDQLFWRQRQAQRLTVLLDEGVEVGGLSRRYREETVRLGLKKGPEAVQIDSAAVV